MESGTRLGPYEILEQLGAGGMGEVWLAEDSRLGRKVAIKVLPVEFATDPERLARFEQEARAAAALNHPHIAVVHDFGASGGIHYMVQEYLQGQPLREALDAGPMSLDKALQLAAEVAEALQAAHAAGIVHRDLKPDNVFVSTDGHAKVLDFGLAKLTEAAAMGGGSATMSPTVLGTEAGVIMGTAGYMAPEQVHGQEVDRRADLFAFGAVLYEMVTGTRAFRGETVIDSLHAITRSEPETLRILEGKVPPQLQRIVDKCLRKDPARRYQHADDLAVDLRTLAGEVESGVAFESADDEGSVADGPGVRTGGGPSPLVLAGAGALLLVLGAAAAWAMLRPELSPSPDPVRFAIGLPDGATEFSRTSRQILRISPDGRRVVFANNDRLWLRTLGEFEPVALPDTINAREPVFSPDSQQIAFWADDKIKRIGVVGGAAAILGDLVGAPMGMSWADDGFIYVGGTNNELNTISRLPETGGAAVEVVEIADPDAVVYGPRLLPGGDWLLFTLAPGGGAWSTAQIVVQSLSTKEQRVLVEGGRDGRVTSSGHLVYVDGGGALLAMPFDVTTMSSAGSAVPLLSGLQTAIAGLSGAAFYDVSQDGVLVYVGGGEMLPNVDLSTLVWFDREGGRVPLPLEAELFHFHIDLSPDGRLVAVAVLEDEVPRIRIHAVDRPGGQRLTSGGSWDPVWSPDGEWVYYSAIRDGDQDIWRRRADLSASEEPVLERPGVQFPATISPDGEWLYFVTTLDGMDLHLLRLPLREGSEPQVLVAEDGLNWYPSISPDGRYMAFEKWSGTERNVFVLDLETMARWPVSAGEAVGPRWSAGGDEIFYQSPEGIMAVAVRTEPGFSSETPRLIVPHRGWLLTRTVSRDGERFLLRVAAEGAAAASVVDIKVVLNWFEELEALVPTHR